MKILSLICVILVLTLSFVPCADAQEISVHNAAALHQHSERGPVHSNNDACSPFCHCSCCANLSVVQLLYLVSIPFMEYQSITTPYFSGKYVKVSLPVWQPPQLV